MILKIFETALVVFSISASLYSLLGFLRLARFYYRIPNLERSQELFSYVTVFVGAFTTFLIFVLLEVIC